jgi:glycosyltransferase involved in cell wall biosynthesis
MKEKLRKKYDLPIEIVYNGFDPTDYPTIDKIPKEEDKFLRIVYTGTIYKEKYNISILFEALKELKKFINIKVDFYTPGTILNNEVKKYGLSDVIQLHSKVSYKESLKKQLESDLLLLFLWNDPKEYGVYSGKFFEYLGSGKSILAIGPKNNIAARLIIEKAAGKVCQTKDELKNAIEYYYNLKVSGKKLNNDISKFSEFTREYQTKRLENFLNSLLKSNRH